MVNLCGVIIDTELNQVGTGCKGMIKVSQRECKDRDIWWK